MGEHGESLMKFDPEMTEDDLTAWIIKNRMLFLFNRTHYTPDYVAYLARIVGFPPEMVYRRFSNFEHALALTNIDYAAAKRATQTVMELTMIGNPVNLRDSWEALGRNLTAGIDFEDYSNKGR